MISQLLVSIATTIIIEVFVASFFFEINREKLSALIATNLMTNILANFGMSLLAFYVQTPYLLNLLIVEVVVLIIELLAYRILLDEIFPKVFLYTVIANLASAIFGLVVTIVEIGIVGVI